MSEPRLAKVANAVVSVQSFSYLFYTSFYPDLAELDEKQATQHWLSRGQIEQRFGDIGGWLSGSEQISTHLPPEFSVSLYRQFNPDLAQTLTHDWEYILHYVKNGHAEGRRCGIAGDRFLSDLYFDGVTPSKSELAALLATKTVYYDLNELLAANGIISQTFLSLFRVPDYITLQHGTLRNRVQCLNHFALQGRAALCPIAMEQAFDPSFYSEIAPAAAGMTPADAYLHWINSGIDSGLAPNPAIFLRKLGLTSTTTFPNAFDHRVYLAANRDLQDAQRELGYKGLTRWEALRHFVREGVAAGRPGCPLEPATTELFVAAADSLSIRNSQAQAKSIYERVLVVDPGNSRALRHYADCLLRLGEFYAAAQIYERTIVAARDSVWTHLNLATCQDTMGQADHASATLQALAHRNPGDRALSLRAQSSREALFESRRGHALWLSRNGLHDKARAAMEHAVGALVEPTAVALPDISPSGRPIRSVLILADMGLPQCKFYRVSQKAEQLRAAGLVVEVFDQSCDIGRFVDALPSGDAAIFYRLPALPAHVRAIAAARRAGIPTFYEIDDLVFDGKYFPDSYESYGGLIDFDIYAGLITGAPLFRAAMALCDYAIAATATLARAMQPHVQSGRAFVHHNALGEQQERLAAAPPRAARKDDVVRIFYGSGTRAHNEDFDIHAAPALARIMDRYANVELIIVGHLTLPRLLASYAARIVRFEPVWDTAIYWGLLAEADINIAVLKPGHIANCKSEIKWLEAAMLRVPSVVSTTETHREIIEHGVDGLLAGSTKEWVAALDRLVGSAAERRRMGEAAHVKAKAERSSAAGSASLLAMFEAVREKRHVAERRRVLVVNVFFPPQAVGGATRVVADNVRQISLEHSDTLEIEVFCTIEGGLVPHQVERWLQDGVRVTGVTTPTDPAINARVHDDIMGRLFGETLDRFQPDLVHFHCIQRLTVSVCDAARARAIPYVVTVHDGWWISDHQFLVDDDVQPSRYRHDDAFAQLRVGGPSSLHRMRTLAAALTAADKVLAVSAGFAALYADCGFERVHVVENGVSNLPVLARRPSEDGLVRLAHIGGASPHKGYTLLRAALSTGSFRNLSLLVIDHAMAPGTEEIERWGATAVQRRGKVAQSQISELYATVDILVATSIWPESYGLVTREALRAGCRVIASDRGAIGADVSGDLGFVIPVDDFAALSKILAHIDANAAHYLAPPVGSLQLRTSREQASELAQIYCGTSDEGAPLKKPLQNAPRQTRPAEEPPQLVSVDARKATLISSKASTSAKRLPMTNQTQKSSHLRLPAAKTLAKSSYESN